MYSPLKRAVFRALILLTICIAMVNVTRSAIITLISGPCFDSTFFFVEQANLSCDIQAVCECTDHQPQEHPKVSWNCSGTGFLYSGSVQTKQVSFSQVTGEAFATSPLAEIGDSLALDDCDGTGFVIGTFTWACGDGYP
jgi:hypothetical protein